jgi:hypothetical protein
MSQGKAKQPARIGDAKVRLIHVARRQLGLQEEDYRAILKLYGQVEHAAELCLPGFNLVMTRFGELGFRSTSPRRPAAPRLGMASPGQVALIRALWTDYTVGKGTEAELGKWLEGHFTISAVQFLTADTAPKVIGALRAMNKRRAAKVA